MTERMVQCVLLKQELPGLTFQTYPGDLGRKVFENVSQQAWKMWMKHQTMLINEHMLNPLEVGHRQFIEQEMQKFFFGEGSKKPEGYVPED